MKEGRKGKALFSVGSIFLLLFTPKCCSIVYTNAFSEVQFVIASSVVKHLWLGKHDSFTKVQQLFLVCFKGLLFTLREHHVVVGLFTRSETSSSMRSSSCCCNVLLFDLGASDYKSKNELLNMSGNLRHSLFL